jgi:hypothetical protein
MARVWPSRQAAAIHLDQEGYSMTSNHKCRHTPCNCDTQGKEYCGGHCATAVAMEEEQTACECHHTACQQAAQRAQN